MPEAGGPRRGDGVVGFFGLRWDDAETVRLTVRPDLINGAGLLSGVATYALVDYGMGSALWPHTSDEEAIATLNISITYLRTARAGDVICRTVVERRNRTVGVMSSRVEDEEGNLLVTATGSYSIFPLRRVAAAG